MAALHWEAQRKQNVIDKKHKIEQEKQEKMEKLQEQNMQEMQQSRARQGSSYERQLKKLQGHNTERCARGEYHNNRDKERRREYYESNGGNHSAKTRLRSSVSISGQMDALRMQSTTGTPRSLASFDAQRTAIVK
ncbi:putative GATA zinc finger domain-containing protein 25 isoform X1 [Asterias rubens]|uniref:putative GATA zinc finger domain-containing protein 25 isoform X1 n=1 Tax=Asterias rubens TaxID=7604 RepID=UPI001455BCBE|nr:putative GATA zinc finger domain-containing protein 25 isoform X1 [Asterias rubens]